jgi:hypothetical protein
MAVCVYCSSKYSDERASLGYNYCLSDSCQKLGLDKSEREFRKEYTPALLHKCNYFWVKKTDLKLLNVRADLDNGL